MSSQVSHLLLDDIKMQSLQLPHLLPIHHLLQCTHKSTTKAVSKFPPSIKILNIHYNIFSFALFLPSLIIRLYTTWHVSSKDHLPSSSSLCASSVLIFLLQCKCLKWKLMTPIGEPPKLLLHTTRSHLFGIATNLHTYSHPVSLPALPLSQSKTRNPIKI